ncbi:MAG: DUF1836 domain-containing protein [Defluviitaleaceae bacterium]|nr:DUF1836 domain-containing protein [Defluviitaleaceae bacterium]
MNKSSLAAKINDLNFTDPVKAFSSYKSEMTLSQVVAFFEKQNIIFTKTMVQHYMKSGILPPLVNKRYYSKPHICALTVIHILKDIYSLEDIKAVFKLFYDEDFEAAYGAFIKMYEEAVVVWKNDLPSIMGDLESEHFGEKGINGDDAQNFLTASLLMAQSAAAKELAKLAIKNY